MNELRPSVHINWVNIYRDCSPEVLKFREAKFFYDERSQSLASYGIIFRTDFSLTMFLTFDNGPELWTFTPCCQSFATIKPIGAGAQCHSCKNEIAFPLTVEVEELSAEALENSILSWVNAYVDCLNAIVTGRELTERVQALLEDYLRLDFESLAQIMEKKSGWLS